MLLAASDFDGTLNCGGVSEENREAIHRFRAAGNRFGLVTGRDYWMYEELVRQGIEFDYVLALNGAMSIRADGSYAYCEHIPNTNHMLREIAAYIGENFHAYCGVLDARERHVFCVNPADYPHEKSLPPEEADRVPQFTHIDSILSSDEEARQAVEEINRRYGDRLNALQNGRCVNIPPAGVDKGEGVARYAAEAGIPAENIYCIGDHLNDMAMITRFHGCAMAHGHPDVLAAAEHAYPTVAALLDHLLTL